MTSSQTPPESWERPARSSAFQRQDSSHSSLPQNQFPFPSTSSPSIPAAPGNHAQISQQRPAMPNQSHARTSSFFSFRSSKQSQDGHNNNPGPSRKLSITGSSPNGAPSGTHQPSNHQSASPSLQTLPSTQQSSPQQEQEQLRLPASPSTQSPRPMSQNPQPIPQPPPLHPEIRSVVSLTVAHAHKIYYSGPLVRRIERQPDGQKPSKDEGWTEVWAQLGGTTLSIWHMKEIQEASRQGKEVPPTYVNVTDAFVQVLGSVTVPATATQPSKRYTNVLTLNTAGSNLLLFSCPSTNALISWAAALRLSAWEKSRLEEIYTAHLIRITLSKPDVATTLIRGHLEGWVRIRVAGQTDWKRVWMVVQAGSEGAAAASSDPNALNGGIGSAPGPVFKKKRMSNLFSRDQNLPQSAGPTKPVISMYTSQKPKDKKKALLSFREVTQAFAVYPERPELIARSTLIKLEGLLGDEELAQSMKSREGWILLMPELEGSSGNQAAEMLKWVIALHDAFELYGRPNTWTWDPREYTSLMFAYPVGPQKDLLFLDREIVETLDPRDDRTSAIRSRLSGLLEERMRQQQPQLVQSRPRSTVGTPNDEPPTLPPITGMGTNSDQQQNGTTSSKTTAGPQLPPLSFSGARTQERILTPITEGGSIMTHGKTVSMDASYGLNPSASAALSSNQPAANPLGSSVPVFDERLTDSPAPNSPTPAIATLSSPNAVPPGAQPSAHAAQSSSIDKTNGVQNTLAPSNQNQESVGLHLKSRSETASPSSDKAQLSPTQQRLTPLVSPHSPSDKPIGISFTNSRASTSSDPRSQSPTGSMLTSPYSHFGDPHQADRMSVLTSPHSLHEVQERANKEIQPLALRADAHPATTATTSPKSVTSQSRSITAEKKQSNNETEGNFFNEAGALYFMQQSRMESGDNSGPSGKPQQATMRTAEDDSDDDDESDSSDEWSLPAQRPAGTSSDLNSRSPPVRQGTPMAFIERPLQTSTTSSTAPPTAPAPVPSLVTNSGTKMPGSPVPGHASKVAPLNMSPGSDQAGSTLSSTRAGLGRKPSGARAQSTSRTYNSSGISSTHQLTEEEETQSEEEMHDTTPAIVPPPPPPAHVSSFIPSQTAKELGGGAIGSSVEVPSDDVLAAISYLNVVDEQQAPSAGRGAGGAPKVEPLKVASGSRTAEREKSPLSTPNAAEPGPQFKSSFAPSNSAAKRKAKAQAQQAAHNAAVHKPGRANGKRKMKAVGAWNDSTEEEDEEEEDEEEADSDGDPAPPNRMQNPPPSGPSASVPTRPSVYGQLGEGTSQQSQQSQQGQHTQLRAPRTLPQPPARPGGDDHQSFAQPRRLPSDQFSEAGRRTYYDDGTQIRTQSEFPQPGAARQTVWSQVLDRNVNPMEQQSHGRDTFVQLEPAETMTKAFTPQGLLSAGLQDKQDRSAKRQEELARETGASLINVPNKPPPPQTGLLGAITAHERERKREGGVGAALTEREREKRLVEERQRRFDEQQRQQMEQMQQGGSMYGGYAFNPMMNPMMMGMNPMMMNPMMTGGGLTPMMTGGGMNPMMGGGGGVNPMMGNGGGVNPMMGGGGGVNPMMGGGGGINPMMGFPGMLNPQQMFAAQQAAAAAYQQAMVAFSVAGSQVNGEGGGAPGNTPMGANGTGNGVPGFDPRMSMMGMPMMGGMGMPVGMGMGMGMGMATPTMTGNFDSRPPPGGSPSGNANGEGNGFFPPTGPAPGLSQFSSNTNSPVGRGSPLARLAEGPDQPGRPATPRV